VMSLAQQEGAAKALALLASPGNVSGDPGGAYALDVSLQALLQQMQEAIAVVV